MFQSIEARLCLLELYFYERYKLVWWLPKTRSALIPTYNSREAYIEVIKHELNETISIHKLNETEKKIIKNARINGYDLGCGDSIIYCLLGAINKWKMVGVDINRKAIEHGKKIVRLNLKGYNPKHRYRSLQTTWEDPVFNIHPNLIYQEELKLLELFHNDTATENYKKDKLLQNIITTPPIRIYDFVMCNPPFFNSKSHDKSFRNIYREEEYGNEVLYPGGEANFVKEVIDESLLKPFFSKLFTILISTAKTEAFIISYIEGLILKGKEITYKFVNLSARISHQSHGVHRSIFIWRIGNWRDYKK